MKNQPKKGKQNLVQVSAFVTAEQREDLQTWGDGNTSEGLRIYGAGILSSKGECDYSLNSPAPNRIGFDLQRVMRTRYRIDTYQKSYFVIDSFQQLFEATFADFKPVYAELQEREAIPAGTVLDNDRVFHRGSGEGWLANGDI